MNLQSISGSASQDASKDVKWTQNDAKREPKSRKLDRNGIKNNQSLNENRMQNGWNNDPKMDPKGKTNELKIYPSPSSRRPVFPRPRAGYCRRQLRSKKKRDACCIENKSENGPHQGVHGGRVC